MTGDELFPEVAGEPRRVSLVRLSGEIARSLAPIGRIAVDGEVYRPVLRGARWWFTLRDRAAQVSVSLAASKSRRYEPADGERVRVTGRLQWVNDRGLLRFEADELAPVGEGAVAALIADARRRLEADGLLVRPRRPIPTLPAGVGVVCGAEAAVRADIEAVVEARFPGFPVRFVEVPVSGPSAVDAIVAAVGELDRMPDVGVIILARGGGDATQLLPFSDEGLCRALCAASTPVVSAIGHDADRPLCDEVADLRCGTPSMAAAAVIPDRAALQSELDRHLDLAGASLAGRSAAAAERLGRIDARAALVAGAEVASRRLAGAGERFALVHPRRQLEAAGARLAAADWRPAATARLDRATARLTAGWEQLEALSPRRVLERGYAVVRTHDGTVIRRATRLAAGDAVRIELAEGRLGARVEDVQA